MAVIGANLRKIHLERNKLEGEVRVKSIKNNILLKSITDAKIKLKGVEKALLFTFEFSSDYLLEKPKGKSLGSIQLVTDIIFSEDPKVVKKILNDWTKKKKIDEKIMYALIRTAFELMEVEAIYLSRKVLLPSPIQLPKVKPPTGQNYIG